MHPEAPDFSLSQNKIAFKLFQKVENAAILLFCPVSCTTTIPITAGTGCKVVTRKGGIKRFVYAKCTVSFEDIEDLAEWQTLMTAGTIRMTGDVKGQKPKGSFTKKKVTSCSPEVVTGSTKTVTYQDFNSDDTGFTDYAFYNALIANQSAWVFGYVTCDDLFYGFIANFSVELDDVREEDVKDNTYFDISLMYEQLLMTVPVKIPGISLL